mmetsp:Transcript_40776/g.105425  ORF Transcript_40776/g.105425 Transcript_40776/m.105425 type:complete len:340 (+) Transcript_40776:672-1691(+)
MRERQAGGAAAGAHQEQQHAALRVVREAVKRGAARVGLSAKEARVADAVQRQRRADQVQQAAPGAEHEALGARVGILHSQQLRHQRRHLGAMVAAHALAQQLVGARHLLAHSVEEVLLSQRRAADGAGRVAVAVHHLMDAKTAKGVAAGRQRLVLCDIQADGTVRLLGRARSGAVCRLPSRPLHALRRTRRSCGRLVGDGLRWASLVRGLLPCLFFLLVQKVLQGVPLLAHLPGSSLHPRCCCGRRVPGLQKSEQVPNALLPPENDGFMRHLGGGDRPSLLLLLPFPTRRPALCVCALLIHLRPRLFKPHILAATGTQIAARHLHANALLTPTAPHDAG